MKHKLLSLCLAFILMLTLAGCGKQPESPLPESPTAPAITADREGNPITLPAEIERIVSLSPAITEMIVDLGAADKLVAVDKYSTGIAGIPADLPVFDMMTPDAESLVALRADVILVTGMSKAKGEDPYKPVTDAGTCVVYIPSSSSIAAIYEDVHFVGELFGKGEEAAAIVDDMRTQVEEVAAIAAAIPEQARRRVYFEIMPMPHLYSFGSGTFLDEMIELVGAVNILSDLESWVSISEEAVLSRNPDVILTNWSEGEDVAGEIAARSGWDAIAAVEQGRVLIIDRDSSSRSNHRITKAMWEIARAIYPEYYTEN